MEHTIALEQQNERTWAFVGTVALVLGMAALQSFQGDDAHALRQYLIVAAIGIVWAGVVYFGILPRVTPSPKAALIFAVLAAVSVVVFWLNLLPSFAGASILTALAVRRAGASRGADVAIGLSLLALVAYVIVSFVG
jgi:hypothetical protein